MELKKIIAAMASKADACDEGLQELYAAVDRKEMLMCFRDNIKFCLSRHIPSAAFAVANFGDIISAYGIYANEHVLLKNQKEMVFLGECQAEIEITERIMCRIWAADASLLHIKAANGARLVIDALDNTRITITDKSGAHVTVYLYGNATCTGADLIVRKGETYEL